MNKSLIVGLVAGAVAVAAGGAFAAYRMIVPSDAQVISAKELTKTTKSPREECHDQEVTRAKPVKDKGRLARTGNTYTITEQHCVTAYDIRQEPDGYDVMYVLHGKRHHVRMDHDPGKRIPVKDGHVVVDDSDDSQPST